MAARRPIRWLAAIVYVVFLGGLLEGTLQAFYYITAGNPLFARVDLPLWAPNPYSGFWNRPSLFLDHRTNEFQATVVTNSQGFRVESPGREYAVAKDPATFRVMLLGPSFAFGWGVEYPETFGARLEAILERSRMVGGRHVELINAGVPALGPISQLEWFEHVGRQFTPDLVIQLIYGSMTVAPNKQDVTPDGYLVPKGMTLRRRIQRQLKNSATIFYGWIVYTRLRGLWGGADTAANGIQGAGRELTEETHFDPEAPAFQRSLKFYDDFANAVAEAKGQALVVYFPLSYSVHPGDMARWRHLGARDVEGQKAFNEAFCTYVDDHLVPCVDITKELVSAARADDERLYYWLDVHWTPEGNRVVADAVGRYLLRERTESARSTTTGS